MEISYTANDGTVECKKIKRTSLDTSVKGVEAIKLEVLSSQLSRFALPSSKLINQRFDRTRLLKYLKKKIVTPFIVCSSL